MAAERRSEAATAANCGPYRPPWVLLLAALGLLTLAVYAPVSNFDFITTDDPFYVSNNDVVQRGLTFPGLVWALKAFEANNWHPLTWFSHMLDCQLFGLDAGAHHLVNLTFHLANSLLVFWVFARMTGRRWRSFFLAGIFALHPLHVESVAWIAERKDVLSGFLALLALWAYARYAEAPTRKNYIAVAGLFALGLAAKPMLITLPFVFLLLDAWPLRRLELPRLWPPAPPPDLPAAKRLWREKEPLLALSLLSALLTLLPYRDNPQFAMLAKLPASYRLGQVVVAYGGYVVKAFWPADLAMFYPLPELTAWSVLGSCALLLALSLLALKAAVKRPYALVGWLWFLGMLVPVIGFVKVGLQSMADRYMYLPLIGLALPVVWGIGDAVESRRPLKIATGFAAGALLFVLAVLSSRQVGYWHDSETLYRHTLAVTGPNPVMHNSLGTMLEVQGRVAESVSEYRDAVRLDPGFELGHYDLGVALGELGKIKESAAELEVAVRLLPSDAKARSNLCAQLNRLRRYDAAIAQCQEALRLDPHITAARVNLGLTFEAIGRTDEALDAFSKVVAEDPGFPGARAELEKLEAGGSVLRVKRKPGHIR
jgi:tetratricopeptide (TPR) repeat protein